MIKNIMVLALLTTAIVDAKKSRPNILFIFSDDHAVNPISAYDGPLTNVAPAPNIDRIAKEGAVFANSFCSKLNMRTFTGKYTDRKAQSQEWIHAERE